MARYTIQRLVQLLAERCEPEDMTRKQAREVVGRLSIIVDYLCDEFDWDEYDREEIIEIATVQLERERTALEANDGRSETDSDADEAWDDDEDEANEVEGAASAPSAKA